MSAPPCPCGQRPRQRVKGGSYLPGCKPCWRAYLDGHSSDTGTSARANYTPPLERDGLLVPAEATREWQRDALRAAEGLGRKNPFRG